MTSNIKFLVFLFITALVFLTSQIHLSQAADDIPKRAEEERRLVEVRPTVPIVAQGYEKIYERFLNGVLIYRPKGYGGDVSRINLPIRDLHNPLDGTFDLSQCDGIGKYFSISTGYRKEKKSENKDKVEIWFAPRFLIERELKTTAKHFKVICDKWKEQAEVGVFWTCGSWDDLTWYDYLTTENMDELSEINLYENYVPAPGRHPRRLCPPKPPAKLRLYF